MLLGSHFSSRAAGLGYLRCRFNLTTSVARFVNDSALACTSPPHLGDAGMLDLPSSVPIEMSNNLQDFTNSGVYFEYQSEVHLTSVAPANGPTSGGSLVTVEGENFAAGLTLCRFGDNPVPATVVSFSTVQCIAPALTSAKSLRVFVSICLLYTSPSPRD